MKLLHLFKELDVAMYPKWLLKLTSNKSSTQGTTANNDFPVGQYL